MRRPVDVKAHFHLLLSVNQFPFSQAASVAILPSALFGERYSLGAWWVFSFFSALPNCAPSKEPRGAGLAEAVARSCKQGCHRQIRRAVERRPTVAERSSRERRFGVQVANGRKFSWATWATKAAKIAVEKSAGGWLPGLDSN